MFSSLDRSETSRIRRNSLEKRAETLYTGVFNAIFLFSFALSNVIGTQVFRPETAPDYVQGKVVILVLFSAAVPTVIAFNYYIRYLNKRKHRLSLIPIFASGLTPFPSLTKIEKDAQLAEMIKIHGWTPEDVEREASKAAFADLTDKENVFMRYLS